MTGIGVILNLYAARPLLRSGNARGRGAGGDPEFAHPGCEPESLGNRGWALLTLADFSFSILSQALRRKWCRRK